MGHHLKDYLVKVELIDGEVSEWFKELVLKTSDSARGRGFESHPLRHNHIIISSPYQCSYVGRGFDNGGYD